MLNKRLADDPTEAAMTSRHEEEVPQDNVNKRHAVGEWVESSFALLSEQEPMREIDVEMSDWLGEDVYVMHPAVPPKPPEPPNPPEPTEPSRPPPPLDVIPDPPEPIKETMEPADLPQLTVDPDIQKILQDILR